MFTSCDTKTESMYHSMYITRAINNLPNYKLLVAKITMNVIPQSINYYTKYQYTTIVFEYTVYSLTLYFQSHTRLSVEFQAETEL